MTEKTNPDHDQLSRDTNMPVLSAVLQRLKIQIPTNINYATWLLRYFTAPCGSGE